MVLGLTLMSVASAPGALSRLDALGMIESGDNDAAVGRAGEISRYQIQPRIWRQYSESHDYQNHRVAKQVAARHLEELQRTFCQCAGRELTEFDVYVLWNAGPTYYRSIGWRRSRVGPVVAERATRYANLRAWEEPPRLRASTPVSLPSTPAGTMFSFYVAAPDLKPDLTVAEVPPTNAVMNLSSDRAGSAGSLAVLPHRVFALDGVQ